MKYATFAILFFIASARLAHAGPVATDGVSTVRLLDSPCASKVALETLVRHGGLTTAMRADLMLAGVFMPCCWAMDVDGDILIADRHGGSITISREAFEHDATPRKPDT